MGHSILLLMGVQQLVSILVLSQEEMSAHPSTLSSYSRSFLMEENPYWKGGTPRECVFFFCAALNLLKASLVAQLVKNLTVIWETWVGKIPWRREWQPTPVFWPGEYVWVVK